MINNIVLCGFMGCGKSTVGNILAERLNYILKDSDQCIEQREKMTVSEIFDVFSEEYFRKVETEVLKELSCQNGIVIATGGGAVLNSDNVSELRKNGTIIFLDVTPETVIERLKNDTSRPLLQRENKEAVISELLCARKPKYQSAAHITVDANRSPTEVADEIISLL